ncbi:MAG: peptidoglycan DD-metalloendopeptidase family protein [Gammaproteobacteria bacterium]|nr:peptidoglycan DD-metalloendopeptidase family protein [Gammaproteobacteria bacterium]
MPFSSQSITFYILIFSILIGLSSSTFANTKEKKQAELNNLQKKINQLQQTIKVKQNSKSQYIKNLRNIEKKIGQINKKIKHSESQIKISQKQLKNLKAKQVTLHKSLKKNKSALKGQIAGAYMQGENSQLQMIFNQQDPAEFQRQLMFYQYFTEQQSKIIDTVYKDIHDLEQTQIKIKKESEKLNNTKLVFLEQKKVLSNDKTNRNKIINNLNSQLKKQGSHLKSLNEDAEQLKQLITSITEIFKDTPPPSKPFHKLKGKLPWPLKGQVRTMFGKIKPGSNLKWQGDVIYAPEGRHVKAISSGQVAYADWLKGFGNLIIIDHGNGYLSLYGRNQSLYKSPGDQVQKGDIISSAGNSGGNKKTGIYFEIRQKGQPKKPSIWCRKKNNFVS